MKRKAKRETAPEWVLQITTLRERLGINQAELARRLECSAMTISRWERGYLQPSAEHFIQLGNLGAKAKRGFFGRWLEFSPPEWLRPWADLLGAGLQQRACRSKLPAPMGMRGGEIGAPKWSGYPY